MLCEASIERKSLVHAQIGNSTLLLAATKPRVEDILHGPPPALQEGFLDWRLPPQPLVGWCALQLDQTAGPPPEGEGKQKRMGEKERMPQHVS